MAINRNGDQSVCMVVGCERAALYRNAESSKTKGTQRGYCRGHKQLAVSNIDKMAAVDRHFRSKQAFREDTVEWQ
jgi:hypothetical protein